MSYNATRYKGSGSPEGVVTAPVGASYQRTDGAVGTTWYLKTTGTGNTGWTAIENSGRELGYAEITSNFGTTSTSAVDVTGLTTTVTVGSRPINIDFGCAMVFNGTSGSGGYVSIYEGATQLAYGGFISTAVNAYHARPLRKRIAPSAGSHTYKITFQAITSGTATISAAALSPAFIQVTEV